MSVNKNNQLLPQAKKLRLDMTPQERKLWYLFLRKYPIKIYKQRIIDSFIVDFYCASAKLVIELDGSQHFSELGMAYDSERSACLSQYGLQVIRFSNADVDSRFDSVCDKIHAVIQYRRTIFTGTPSQSPPTAATAPPKGEPRTISLLLWRI